MPGGAVACVEIGGSGVETVLFDAAGGVERVEGAVRPKGARLAISCPGIIADGRVVAASSLDWFDVDPAEELGLGTAELVLNDAAAAALGEVALRDGTTELVYVGLGTGVGAAVARDGTVVADNLLGHLPGFSTRRCRCGRTGCLETVAAGWALPDSLTDDDLERAAEALVQALRAEPEAKPSLVVLAGGVVRRYPRLAQMCAELVPERTVQHSAAPTGFKSAAAWGLRHALEQATARLTRGS